MRRLGEPLLGGNRVELFSEAASGHEGLMSALAQAKAHVNLDATLLYSPSLRAQLIDQLMRVRGAGARVQVLTCHADHQKLGSDLATLNAAGVTLSGTLGPRAWTSTIGRHGVPLRRQLAVIDGRMAWIGPGLYDETLEADEERSGLHLQLQGPAVALLQRLFLATWQGSSPRAPMARTRYFPTLPLSGEQRIGLASNAFTNETGRPGKPLLGAASIARSSLAVTLTNAVATTELAKALSAAANRGVQVTVLLPACAQLSLLWKARVDEWMGAGVRVWQSRPGQPQAAVCVVDRVWASVLFSEQAGRQSHRFGGQAELLVLDEAVPAQLQQLHQQLCAGAQPLERVQWSAPLGWLRRVGPL